MTTGQRIKNRRKSIGLSAEQLADFLGCSPATIYRYENGDIEKVPGDRLGTIAKALQTTPAFLMGWDEEPVNFNVNFPSLLPQDCSPLKLTSEEADLIKKYRCLDGRGKSAVLNVLEYEYNSLPGDKANSAPKQA